MTVGISEVLFIFMFVKWPQFLYFFPSPLQLFLINKTRDKRRLRLMVMKMAAAMVIVMVAIVTELVVDGVNV